MVNWIHTSYAMFLSGLPWNISQVTCIFLVHRQAFRQCVITTKIQVTSGIFHGNNNHESNCMIILCLVIDNTVANTIHVGYAWHIMGR